MKLKQVFFLLISIELKGFHHRMVSMQLLKDVLSFFHLVSSVATLLAILVRQCTVNLVDLSSALL